MVFHTRCCVWSDFNEFDFLLGEKNTQKNLHAKTQRFHQKPLIHFWKKVNIICNRVSKCQTRLAKRVSINMEGIKQKSRRKKQKRRMQRHKRSILAVSSVIILLMVVVSVNSMTLKAKEKEYKSQITELESQIDDEKARTEDIDRLEEYVGTDEYVEDVAKDKLGLIHENEIIFRAE